MVKSQLLCLLSYRSAMAHRQGVEPRTPSFGDSDGRRSTVLVAGGDGEIRTLNSRGLNPQPLPLGYVPIWLAWSGLNRLSLAYKTRAYTCYASRRWYYRAENAASLPLNDAAILVTRAGVEPA